MRVGAMVKSLLTTVCGAAMLMSAAAILDPATLQAGSTAGAPPQGATNENQQLVDSVSAIIRRSERVLALRPGEADRGAEVVLWLHDSHDRGRINADELALIRHNRLFQTVTCYSVPPRALDARPTNRAPSRAPQADRASEAVDVDVHSPGFTDRWRAMSAVQARVLAAGISDMRVETYDAGGALSSLRVHLQWAGDSVDGGFEASAIVTASGPDAARTLPHRSSSTPQQEYKP